MMHQLTTPLPVILKTARLSPRLQAALLAASAIFIATTAANAGVFTLDFNAQPGTILDSAGAGTGFPERLSGTGSTYTSAGNSSPDSNLLLNTTNHTLSIVTPAANPDNLANHAGHPAGNANLDEDLGLQLSSLGFTGTQDFSVTATFSNIQYSADFDEFGIIIGSQLINSYRIGPGYDSTAGSDAAHSFFIYEGAHKNSTSEGQMWYGNNPKDGDTITLKLSRTAGLYSLAITDPTHSSGTQTINISTRSPTPPSFLNSLSDLTVGIYANSAGDTAPPTETLTAFSVTVVETPEPCSLALLAIGTAALLTTRRKPATKRSH